MLLDVHTHHVSAIAGTSIQQVDPESFVPTAGRYYSVGIHPWKATEADEHLQALDKAVRHPAVLAVGEAGLDRWASADLSVQEKVFVEQIRLSEEVEKPLIIHCVKAFNELIVLKRKHRPRMPWVVHGFRNNPNIARMLTDEGIYFSLGEKYQPEVLPHIAPTRLLTETDESNFPIEKVIAHIAADLGSEVASLYQQIDENARNIFFRS